MRNPIVTLHLQNNQTVNIELYPEFAPISVANFIHLVQKGFYNGLSFHRVIPGFMVQGGCPIGNGTGGPDYRIKGEFSGNGVQNSLRHSRGVISMARSGHPDSAGSQFFIMVADAPHLEGQYAAFGKVLSGMDVIDQVVNVKRDPMDKPLSPQVILEAIADTFGTEYPHQKL